MGCLPIFKNKFVHFCKWLLVTFTELDEIWLLPFCSHFSLQFFSFLYTFDKSKNCFSINKSHYDNRYEKAYCYLITVKNQAICGSSICATFQAIIFNNMYSTIFCNSFLLKYRSVFLFVEIEILQTYFLLKQLMYFQKTLKQYQT